MESEAAEIGFNRMKKPKLILLLGLMIGALPAALANEVRDTHTAVTPRNFDAGGAVSRQFHLNAESYRTTATIARTGPVRKLEVAPSEKLADFGVRYRGGRARFEDYAKQDALLDGVIVVHDGSIVFESYRSMEPWQRHFAWSVSKVIAAATVAALAHDGRVDVAEPVDTYVTDLANTKWAGIAVRDIANMASGMDCLDSDGYQDNTTCIYRMEETLGITADAGYEASFLEHLRGMQRHSEPGVSYEYVSANTNVLMLVAEAVTGQPYATAVRELIWDHIGAEADALVAISDEGHAYASGGIIARLRDIARFGELFVKPDASGVFDRRFVDDMQRSGVSLGEDVEVELIETFGADLPVRASWQWDRIWEDGGMHKSGYLGQGLYVDPDRSLVIAWYGTGLDFDERNNDMLPISRQLARSGLFDSR